MESQTGLVLQCRLREPYSDASATVWVGWDIAGHHHHHHYHLDHHYRGLQSAQMGVGFLIALPAALALMLIAEKVGCLVVWTFHRPSCEKGPQSRHNSGLTGFPCMLRMPLLRSFVG